MKTKRLLMDRTTKLFYRYCSFCKKVDKSSNTREVHNFWTFQAPINPVFHVNGLYAVLDKSERIYNMQCCLIYKKLFIVITCVRRGLKA